MWFTGPDVWKATWNDRPGRIGRQDSSRTARDRRTPGTVRGEVSRISWPSFRFPSLHSPDTCIFLAVLGVLLRLDQLHRNWNRGERSRRRQSPGPGLGSLCHPGELARNSAGAEGGREIGPHDEVGPIIGLPTSSTGIVS